MVAVSEKTLSEMTRRLVDALRPERIYLFGSHAYGKPTSSSDLDLAVVLPDSRTITQHLYAVANDAVGTPAFAIDLKLYNADRFDRRSGWQANMEHTIRNKGRLLYGEDGMSFAKEWLDKGFQDMRAAEQMMSAQSLLPNIIAFHCQQAAEEGLKAFLVHKNGPFEKAHGLAVVCDLCAKFDATFSSLRDAVGSLNQYAVKFRYPGERDVTDAEAAGAFDSARHTLRFILDRLPKDLADEFEAFLA